MFFDTLGTIFAAGAFLAATASLVLLLRDRGTRLKVVQEEWEGMDNDDVLPRFAVYNFGAKPVYISSIMVDVSSDTANVEVREGPRVTPMGVEEGNVPGLLPPGDHIRLNAYVAANVLSKRGLSGEVEARLVITDDLGKEYRYPITMVIGHRRVVGRR